MNRIALTQPTPNRLTNPHPVVVALVLLTWTTLKWVNQIRTRNGERVLGIKCELGLSHLGFLNASEKGA